MQLVNTGQAPTILFLTSALEVSVGFYYSSLSSTTNGWIPEAEAPNVRALLGY